MFKFAIKVGLAAGAVYYISEQGVWKDSKETTHLSGKISENLSPYLQQAKKTIPVEIPELPSTNRISYLTKQYWNKGVTATFVFLGDLPKNTSIWTKAGVETVKSNPEIKNFIESFSSSPQTNQQQKK